MKKYFNQSKSIFTLLIALFLFSSCGHYAHKIRTSEKKDLVFTVHSYNKSRTYGDKDVNEHYVVHYKDSLYHIKNIRYEPEVIGDMRSSVERQKSLDMILFADLVPEIEIDDLSRYKDSIYYYMIENPKGSLKPLKVNKHYLYQTHIFLDSMEITDNSIELGPNDITAAHFFYKSRFVQRMIVLGSVGAVVIGLFTGIIVAFSNI